MKIGAAVLKSKRYIRTYTHPFLYIEDKKVEENTQKSIILKMAADINFIDLQLFFDTRQFFMMRRCVQCQYFILSSKIILECMAVQHNADRQQYYNIFIFVYNKSYKIVSHNSFSTSVILIPLN